MKKTEVRCDSCDRDLTYTGNCEDYCISLSNESIRSKDGVVTLMVMEPPLKSNAHFCGVGCLKTWINKEYPNKNTLATTSEMAQGYADTIEKTSGILAAFNKSTQNRDT